MTQLFSFVQAWLASHRTDERGATMVEYGLMVALIAVVCLVAVALIGTNLNSLFSKVAGSI
jgi:pilus assembly protein Flp/PilA